MSAELVESFRDTQRFLEDELMRLVTCQAIQNTKVYCEGFRHTVSEQNKANFHLAQIEVIEDTTFAAAKRYARLGKTAVLNFANPEIPGGGVVNGARAQEECLCRSSNLYACISAPDFFEDYYLYNKNYRFYYTDRLIYTPGVIVFKNEESIPQYMPEEEWFQTDVITCAAPMMVYVRQVDEKELEKVLKSRIKNIFEVAVEHHVQNLILGAFGCGAFKNPPQLVAKAFQEVILENGYDGMFENIVFAIKKVCVVCPNLEAFQNAFAAMPKRALREREIRFRRWIKGFFPQ